MAKKIYPVLLLSSEQEEVYRMVEVSDYDLDLLIHTEDKLSVIYRYGQNDNQKVEPRRCSVSMGDVIFFDGWMYVCQRFGFMKVTLGEVRELQRLPRRDRQFHKLVDPD